MNNQPKGNIKTVQFKNNLQTLRNLFHSRKYKNKGTRVNKNTNKGTRVNKNTRRTFVGHKKGNFFFTSIPPEIRSQFQYDEESLYSITDERTANKITEALLKLKGINKHKTITDMTACVGGNVLSFAKSFSHVNAIELDKVRCDMLINNVKTVSGYSNVNFFCGNGIDVIRSGKTRQDIIFADPPWGGMEYINKNYVSLSLKNDMGNEYDLSDLVKEMLKYAKYIAFKVPINFDVIHFNEKINSRTGYHVLTIKNLRRMHLYVISKIKRY